QAPSSTDNTRSTLNAYDGLDRLTGTDVGALAIQNGTPSMTSPARRDGWGLDLLGNWSGAGQGTTAVPGRWVSGDGVYLDEANHTALTQFTDRRNRIGM